MPVRAGSIHRETVETDVVLSVTLDGIGDSTIDTGVGFLDHMLTLFSRHSRFNLTVKCDGDTYVDDHHSVEDIGICLGTAFAQALGERRGINRYGHIVLPMDEALILCAVDISGRAHLSFDADFPTEKVGTFDTELVEEFMAAFVRTSGVTLHIKKLAGANSHHIAEGMFKALGRTLKQAAAIDITLGDEIPSTKGVL